MALFTDLARDAGAADPEALAAAFNVLYDGAAVGGRMDRGPGACANARTPAELLLDRSLPR